MRKMPLNLMILTSYFAIEPKNIRGGIGYRFVGLYGSLIKTLLRHWPESKVFWYSKVDCCLRVIDQSRVECQRLGMLKAVLKAASDSFKSGARLAVIIGYPYAIPGIRRLSEYIFGLLILKFLSVGHVRVIVDYFDPPVEGAFAFSEAGPSIRSIIYLRMLDLVTLRLSSIVIALSEFWRHYIARTYHISRDKILVVPNGTLVRHIRYNPPKAKGSLTVLYAGSALKVKSIDKLIQVVAMLKEKGLSIDLRIAGAKEMNLPEWVNVGAYNWPDFIANVLCTSDVCVIPYPPARMAFYYSLPAKLFDYMAAGKPIISTNLKDVGAIVKKFDCGLVANEWKEFELHLERLYHDRELAKKLGKNGRVAAEKNFNYELLGEGLFAKLVKMFEGSINGER